MALLTFQPYQLYQPVNLSILSIEEVMKTLTLSADLQSETIYLLQEFTPYHICIKLRTIYMEYLYSMMQAGTPPEFDRELLMMDAIFKWLDAAVQETKEWNMGDRQFYGKQ